MCKYQFTGSDSKFARNDKCADTVIEKNQIGSVIL